MTDQSTGQWEELRLALIMNGGVSLAVWMGGVSNEIFRVVTQQHPVYRGLLELTRTTARVDVISGTSAGGINGAAMAIALLYGGDFAKLRQTWLDTGAFNDLLRPPLGENPGSLLKGDEYFLPAIQEAFASLAVSPTPVFDEKEMPIDLRLTTTLLSGYQRSSVDDLGAPLHDVDYRAYFRFRHKHDKVNTESDFGDAKDMAHSLARAARSTASFPFAFEPSRISKDDAGTKLFNYQKEKPEFLLPRYVVDGGVLDNKPFRGAREAIFAMPRSVGVRRVLAYINPDPGDGPPFKPDRNKNLEPPSLAKVLAAGIIGIPQSQSVADELNEIKEHNETVRARRDSVLTLAEAFSDKPQALEGIARDLFAVYRKRRLATTFEVFLFEPLSAAASRKPKLASALAAIGKQGREALKLQFTQALWRDWIPQTWPDDARDPRNANDESWEWGLFPVEFAAKVMLNLLRMMQSLADHASPHDAGGEHAASSTRANEEGAACAEGDWHDDGSPQAMAPKRTGKAWNPDEVKQFRARATTPADELQALIADQWNEASRIIEDVWKRRLDEQPFWNRNTEWALAKLGECLKTETSECRALMLWQTEQVPRLFKFIAQPHRRALCAGFAYRIAEVVRKACDVAAEICEVSLRSGRLRPTEIAAATSLAHLARLLSHGNDERDTLFTLLQMEVAEFAFTDHDVLQSDALIELVQISGNSSSPLGGREVAKGKLLGLQLAHFGAFYKRSWRANDWAYGRLDGSERLVKLLLNPERLHRVFYPHGSAAAQAIRRLALDDVPSLVLKDELDREWKTRGLAQRIDQELAFLDSTDSDLPSALPACAEAITLRLHYGILREELEVLGAAVNLDVSEGADRLGAGAALVQNLQNPQGKSTAPFTPGQAAARLAEGLIATEDFAQEVGSDLFTRTLAHSLATLQGTLATKAAKLGPVSLFFASLRLPLLGFHYVAQGLIRQSRTAAALHGAMLSVGLALVLLQYLWPAGAGEHAHTALPAGALHFGWALLGFGLFISIVKVPRTMGAVLCVAVVALLIWGPQELDFFALVVLLLTLSLTFPFLQIVFGLAVVALAALHNSAWKAELWREIPLHDPVFRFGLLIIVALLVATMQAAGLFTFVERALRAWRASWLRRKISRT